MNRLINWLGIGLTRQLRKASNDNVTNLHRLINTFGAAPNLNTELDGLLLSFGVSNNTLERRSGKDRRQHPHPDPKLDRRSQPPILRNISGIEDTEV